MESMTYGLCCVRQWFVYNEVIGWLQPGRVGRNPTKKENENG